MSLRTPEHGMYFSQHDGGGRGRLITSHDSDVDADTRTALEQIPAINPKDFHSPDPETQRRAKETVMHGLTDIGFVFVETPEVFAGLPEVYAANKRFFDLPEDAKLRYANSDIHYQRGYTPFHKEISIFCRYSGPGRTEQPDEKENLFFGPDLPENHPLVKAFPELYAHNIWPKEVPEFRQLIPKIRQQLFDVGMEVLDVVEEARGYPKGFFADMTKDSATLLRPLHYPPLTQEAIDKGAVWGCEHTDINLVTVLPASTKRGLRVKRRDGEWVAGMAPPNHSIVQVGDMLQYITRKELLSANHKVDAPKEPTLEGRHSMALFIHPRANFMLEGDRPTEPGKRPYPPILAGDYLMKRLEKIGLAEKNSPIKIGRVSY